MKKSQHILFLLISISLVSRCYLKSSVQEPVLKDVTPIEANEIIQQYRNDSNFVFMDVRTPDEYQESHIAYAINLDFYSANFQHDLEALDRNKTYLIYCRSGNRSSQTFSRMQNLGFRHVFHLLGGIKQWKQTGLAIEQ